MSLKKNNRMKRETLIQRWKRDFNKNSGLCNTEVHNGLFSFTREVNP